MPTNTKNMAKSKAEKQAALATDKEVTLPEDGTPLPQEAGEIAGTPVVDLTKGAKAKTEKPVKTAEELEAERLQKEEEDRIAAEKKAAAEAELAEAETSLKSVEAAYEEVTATLKAAKERVRNAKLAVSGKPGTVMSPRVEGKGVIEAIIDLYANQNKTRPEIIAMGYNKSTVQRQIGEYIQKNGKNAADLAKASAAPAAAAPVAAPTAEASAEPVVEGENNNGNAGI